LSTAHPRAWTLAAGYFAYFLAIGVFTPYWSVWLAAQGHSALVIGQLAALVALLRVVGPFAVAWAFDHAQSRQRWLVGCTCLALATLGLLALQAGTGAAGPGSSPAVPLLAVALAMAVYSLSYNALMPAYDAYVLDCLGREQGRYGRWRLWGSVGFIVASTLVGAWQGATGPQVILWATCLGIAATSLTFAALPPAPARTTPPAPAGAFFLALRQPAVLVFLAVSFLQLASFGAYYTFFSLYLQRHGYGSTHIGLLWAWGVAAEIAVFVCAPWLVARLRLRTLLQWALLGTAVRWAVLAVAVDVPWVVWTAQVLHLAGFGLFHTVTVLLLPRLLPPGSQARAQALSSSLGWGAGGIAGSLLAGWVWSEHGPDAAFVASAALAAAAALLAWRGLRGAQAEAADPRPAYPSP
jgi:MFS transporter, PPP family, 3-phenylpropionic acid transporter